MTTPPDPRGLCSHDLMRDGSRSSAAKYAELAVGEASVWRLLLHEAIVTLCGGLPGALGYALRRWLYPLLLGSCGKGVTIGRGVTLRGARRVHLGDGVSLDDFCVLDARGPAAEIRLGRGALVSRNTVLRARNGQLLLGDGCDIGSNCIFGTDSRLVLGREVLVAAFTYVVAGGNHNHADPNVPIVRQGVTSRGGVEIGEGCWLGARVTVLDGVRIGEHTIVGAHALVTKSLPARCVAHGTPAVVVRERSAESAAGPSAPPA